MLGSIISGVGSVLGGLFGSSAAKKDREMQLYLATHGVRLRAEDARAAGIHPLAALGASMPSYTPVGDGGLGAGLADAAAAFGSAADNAGGDAKLDKDLQARAVEADIDLKSAQATALRAQAVTGIQATKAITMGAETGAHNMQDTSGTNRTRGVNYGSAENPPLENLGNAAGLTTMPDGKRMITPNMDNSPDPETDLWFHFRNGTIGKYMDELMRKNSELYRKISAYVATLPYGHPLRAAVEATGGGARGGGW